MTQSANIAKPTIAGEGRSRLAWFLGAGVVFSAALHASLIAATLVDFSPDAQLGALDEGVGGIDVELAMSGSAPGSEASMYVPQMTKKAEPEAEQAEKEEKAQKPLEEILDPVEEVAEAQPLEPISEAAPDEPEAVQAAEEPRALIKPPEDAETGPEPKLATTVEPVELDAVEQTQTLVAQAAQIAGAGGRSGTDAQHETGSGKSTHGGGGAKAKVTYLAKLRDWLEKHKEYPASARSRKTQGTVKLLFIIDLQGHVLDAHVTESSGHKVLDDAAIAMIKSAEPLPALPPELGRTELALLVPVQFYLH